MNEKLLEVYLGGDMLTKYSKTIQDIATELPSSKNPMDVISQKGIPWSYEVLSEVVSEDFGPRSFHLTVAVYLPGLVRIGAAGVKLTKKESDIQARNDMLKEAINNAMSTTGIQYTKAVPIVPKTESEVSEQPKEEPKVEQPKPQTQPQTQAGNDPAPTQKKAKFAPEQVARMKAFQAEMKITTDEELIKYMKRWDPKATSKSYLNEVNIEEFFTFVGA